jgi:hypothetical protein
MQLPNDLHINIPINNTLNITTKLLKANNIDTLTCKEMTNILMTVLNPNYCKHKGYFHKPQRRIVIGAPLSGIMAETFILYIYQ